MSGPPDYRAGKELDLDILRCLLLGAVGFRANLKGKRAGVNYRLIFMKPQGDELAQIAILVRRA